LDAQPGADLLSFILALGCFINEYRKLKKQRYPVIRRNFNEGS
jgi:hypothetical protein